MKVRINIKHYLKVVNAREDRGLPVDKPYVESLLKAHEIHCSGMAIKAFTSTTFKNDVVNLVTKLDFI